jgi:hypothetical protein
LDCASGQDTKGKAFQQLHFGEVLFEDILVNLEVNLEEE